MFSSIAYALFLQSAPAAPQPPQGLDWGIWKWVIIIGVAAIVVIYAVKRIADVVVDRKTRTMIRDVVGEDADGQADEEKDGSR